MLLVLITGKLSQAKYQKEVEIPFINARVGEFTVNDIQLAMLLDGKEVEIPPSKDNYTVDISCDNATGRWDMDEWGAMVTNITAAKVKCEVNFHTPEATLSEVTATAEKTSISLSYTAGGIGTSTTCVYGTEEGNYTNSVEEVQNTSCNITGLEMGTTYYYKVCSKNATGETCKEGSIKTKPKTTPFTSSDVGKYVNMTPTSTSYIISKDLTGTSSDQTINPSELHLWRIISVDADGLVEMVSDKISSKTISIGGSTGYKNIAKILESVSQQYTDNIHVLKTRSVGYGGQTLSCESYRPNVCTVERLFESDLEKIGNVYGGTNCSGGCKSLGAKDPNGKEGWYYLPSRFSKVDHDNKSNNVYYYYHVINTGVVSYTKIYEDNYAYTGGAVSTIGCSVRPVVSLNREDGFFGGSGTQDDPYTLS